MRRVGTLFPLIISYDNVRLAWRKVIRGKSDRKDILEFKKDLDINLLNITQLLSRGDFRFGRYKVFTIHDPKEREIRAADIPERIVHHAIMNILDPLFDSRQISDSYACRKNKGTAAAILRVFKYAKTRPYFLKLDIRKYFDSIDHEILFSQLGRFIKDVSVLNTLRMIIDSHNVLPGKGLPIGNLTSQYFANHYLGVLDHNMKDGMKIPVWIRYMDDIICLGNSKNELNHICNHVESFTESRLALSLKPKIIGKTVGGVPFLGFLIKPNEIFPMQKTKIRFKRNFGNLDYLYRHSYISEEDYAARTASLCAHLEIARARGFMHNVVYGRVLRQQPGQTRRQLEQ